MCCAVTLHRQLRVDAVTAMRLVLRSASDHSRIPRVASSRFARLLFAAPSLLSLPLRFAPHQRFALRLFGSSHVALAGVHASASSWSMADTS